VKCSFKNRVLGEGGPRVVRFRCGVQGVQCNVHSPCCLALPRATEHASSGPLCVDPCAEEATLFLTHRTAWAPRCLQGYTCRRVGNPLPPISVNNDGSHVTPLPLTSPFLPAVSRGRCARVRWRRRLGRGLQAGASGTSLVVPFPFDPDYAKNENSMPRVPNPSCLSWKRLKRVLGLGFGFNALGCRRRRHELNHGECYLALALYRS